MKTVKVYKDNLREHIFRTMFFTDTVLFLGTGLFLAVGIFVLYKFTFHLSPLGPLLACIFLAELFYGLVATLKIDHQPLYKIIPRAFIFSLTKKTLSLGEVAKTTGDFKIIGNYIVRHKKLIGVYEIRPFDIALLNDEERERYYQHIKTMLHTLPSKVQLISRKQRAGVKDYHEHIFSLYKSSNNAINPLLEQYINDLSVLIEQNNFQLMKYYAVFTATLLSESDIPYASAVQKLEDQVKRFSSALALERITTHQVSQDDLIALFQQQFRNI